MRNHDLVFLKHFSLVIAFLMAVALMLALFAFYMHGMVPHEPSPAAEARVLERIQPVGAVYAGETGAAAMAAAAEAARQAAAAQVAYGGTLEGSVIYGNLCGSCHNSVATGAPVLTHAAWAPRVTQGVETLVRHAIEGYQGSAGVMPARGGNPALTDAQVEATVKWMLENLK